MDYRNGTYVAFNGMGTTDPTKGDMKYYGLLQAWSEKTKIDFSFSDSHKKTYSVKDSSTIDTLKSRLVKRFKKSKQFLVIITDNSSINRGLLNWEIEKAKEYDLPIIVAYVGKDEVRKVSNKMKDFWPKKLKEAIENDEVKSIHIPFKKALIKKAVEYYSIKKKPSHSISVYKASVYEEIEKTKI
jgi:hypothetical protein